MGTTKLGKRLEREGIQVVGIVDAKALWLVWQFPVTEKGQNGRSKVKKTVG